MPIFVIALKFDQLFKKKKIQSLHESCNGALADSIANSFLPLIGITICICKQMCCNLVVPLDKVNEILITTFSFKEKFKS